MKTLVILPESPYLAQITQHEPNDNVITATLRDGRTITFTHNEVMKMRRFVAEVRHDRAASTGGAR